MSYGMPIIASRTGGIPEIVIPGKTGQLITAGHIEEIAESIFMVSRSPRRKKRNGPHSARKQPKIPTTKYRKELTELYSRYL